MAFLSWLPCNARQAPDQARQASWQVTPGEGGCLGTGHACPFFGHDPLSHALAMLCTLFSTHPGKTIYKQNRTRTRTSYALILKVSAIFGDIEVLACALLGRLNVDKQQLARELHNYLK